MLWDLNDSKHLYSLDAGNEIHSLVFSPNRYWLCAAAGSVIKIFDLETKSIVEELKVDFIGVGKKSQEPQVTCLSWSADGQTLFSGYTDGLIRVSSDLSFSFWRTNNVRSGQWFKCLVIDSVYKNSEHLHTHDFILGVTHNVSWHIILFQFLDLLW